MEVTGLPGASSLPTDGAGESVRSGVRNVPPVGCGGPPSDVKMSSSAEKIWGGGSLVLPPEKRRFRPEVAETLRCSTPG